MLAPVSGYGGFNTSLHRLHALRSLGLETAVVDSTLPVQSGIAAIAARLRPWLFRKGLPVAAADPSGDAAKLLAAASAGPWELVWLEKALTIDGGHLRALRRAAPGAMIIGFSPDDMHSRHNQSLQFLDALPHYDAFLTTKTFNVDELRRAGCPRVLFVGNGYDPLAFRPMPVSAQDIERLGGDVGFIGSFEQDRHEAMKALARQGLRVRVWGSGWDRVPDLHPGLVIERRPLRGDDFARACSAFKINLAFLRKLNRDQQTTRSVEIPACGGFMLAERTPEHLRMFAEGEEAEFFSSVEELAAKCRRYIDDSAARASIARRGHERCIRDDYSNAAHIARAFRTLGLGEPPVADAAACAVQA
ncbi:MAG: glycosyltransferase [Pseudomonadota bacterium]|nr:glycosyltransferase [Pseudomonadota bacterium]